MTLLNVKKTSLKKSEINKITYVERHWLLGKIAKFAIFFCHSQQDMQFSKVYMTFLQQRKKRVLEIQCRWWIYLIELEFLGILILLKWTNLHVTSSQVLLLLLHQTGFIILRVLCTDENAV